MTDRRKFLLARLVEVQNHPRHQNRDILTITGCGMTDDEVARHLASCIGQTKPRQREAV